MPNPNGPTPDADMHLLLCNDDGIDAEGLQTLRSTLLEAVPGWRITTVAPDREQSATSHSLTLSDPLRIQERGGEQYAVSGTPTDCVLVAMKGLLKDDPPQVVLSGINHGPNMGEDVHYSGTVAAAFEGLILGLPAIALSLASKARPRQFSGAIRFLRDVLPGWIESLAGRAILLNVNLPALPADEVRGIRVCALGSRQYDDLIIEKTDPRGRKYYWIGGDACTYEPRPDSDFVLSAEGWITVTPLRVDITDHDQLAAMRELVGDWPK